MNKRLGKLEGQQEGLKQSQAILMGAVTVVAAILIGVGIYGIQKTEDLSKKVDALPGQISSELRDITKTLAESITAAKQQPPQIIVMPTPPVLAPNNQK